MFCWSFVNPSLLDNDKNQCCCGILSYKIHYVKSKKYFCTEYNIYNLGSFFHIWEVYNVLLLNNQINFPSTGLKSKTLILKYASTQNIFFLLFFIGDWCKSWWWTYNSHRWYGKTNACQVGVVLYTLPKDSGTCSKDDYGQSNPATRAVPGRTWRGSTYTGRGSQLWRSRKI